MLDAKAYFAHPYHSWERGLNENTNGLIRQYFPKGTSFDKLSIEDVKRVEDLLNTRPRKCLAYQTPNDTYNPPPPIALAA
jgi:transposase, IS30 family